MAGRALMQAVNELGERSKLPIRTETMGLGDLGELFSTFRAIQMYEAWQLHGLWVRAHGASLGPGIAARFESASHVDASSIDAARERQAAFRARFAALLGGGSYLVHPAASGPAPPIWLGGNAKDDLRLRTMMVTSPAGLAGSPVISLPLASCEGLPVGLAVVGLPGDDLQLTKLAAQMTKI
jgi:amidase